MQYLKKLRITLRYKVLFILIFSLLYSYYYNINFKSKFSNENIIYGYVTNYYIIDNKVTIYLNSKEKILCTYNGTFNYKLGDYLKLEGKLEIPTSNTVFNYKEYLKYEHINYIFKTSTITKIKNNNRIRYKIKTKIMNLINKRNNYEYLYAFILGNTKYINKDVINSYRTNGISHLFSISGMHVSLLTLVIYKIFNKSKYKNIIAIFFIIFYMFLTDFSPSILRAGLSYILFFINKKYKLKISNIDIMLILLTICIIIDPFIIYKIGFQYSYIVSFYLICFKDLIRRQKNKFNQLLVISIISFIASLPITINNFNQINLFSILLNLFFVPLVSIIIFPLILLSAIFPLRILKIIIFIFESISMLFCKVKLFIIIFPKLNIVLIILYYIISFYVLNRAIKYDYKKIIILLLIILIYKFIPYFDSSIKIAFIDVGQGDSILIKLKNNKSNILIDTGISTNNNVIEDFLKSIGITRLDYMILTHGDADHMGEAINLVNNFKVEKVIFNCGSFNDLENELIKVLDKKKISYYSCIKELNIDNNKLYFLQTSVYDNENDNSNVIYTEINGYKFMFMGDASSTTEKEILSKYNLPNIDVLKVGHHGSKTSTSIDFINEINPKYSIISVGKNNRYGHPNKEVLDNLNESKIYRTDEDGSIMFKIKNNKLQIETCPP